MWAFLMSEVPLYLEVHALSREPRRRFLMGEVPLYGNAPPCRPLSSEDGTSMADTALAFQVIVLPRRHFLMSEVPLYLEVRPPRERKRVRPPPYV